MAEIDKYQNAKVYKIHCNITQTVYVGSTTSDLPKRLGFHESAYKAYKKGDRGYVSSFEVLKGDDYQIILLERFPCESRQQLLIREGLYVKAIPCVNKQRPARTKAQYYQDNKV